MAYKQVELLENIHLHTNIYQLSFPYDGTVLPGQFVMVRSPYSSRVLPRAISVSEVTDGKMVLIYQKVGHGTSELSRLVAGDPLDVTGPIGMGFPVGDVTLQQRVALVGGGVGTAPLVETAKYLKSKQIPVEAHLGFRERSILSSQLSSYCDQVSIATESGDEGVKGLVTATFQAERYDIVFCCGPTPMMKAVVAESEKAGVPCYISLENKMACGIGACLVCTCTKTDGSNHRSCIEGPVFLGKEVDFNA